MTQLSIQQKTHLKSGELLMEEGLIGAQDVERALAIQKKSRSGLSGNPSRLFGMICCDLNLITPMDNYHVLNKHQKLVTVQDYLGVRKILTRDRIKKYEARSRQQGIPFISLLLELKALSKTQLANILFDLFHVPLRSISDFVFSREDHSRLSDLISKKEAKTHRLIPLMLKGQTLLCGITEPDNLEFMQSLSNRFPLYRFEAWFIPFSGFIWFYKLIYGEAFDPAGRRDLLNEGPSLSACPVLIRDPIIEKDRVMALYAKYEQSRKSSSLQDRGDRHVAFQTFIMEKHQAITEKFQCRAVEFSLEQRQGQLMVTAFPTDEDEGSWQK